MILVMLSEFVVDWVKHAFITKFNEIPSEVFLIQRSYPTPVQYRRCCQIFGFKALQYATILPLMISTFKLASKLWWAYPREFKNGSVENKL